MLTIDDDDINDRFQKRDVGDGFVSAAENNPAEIRNWRRVHGWGEKCGGRGQSLYTTEMYTGRLVLRVLARSWRKETRDFQERVTPRTRSPGLIRGLFKRD